MNDSQATTDRAVQGDAPEAIMQDALSATFHYRQVHVVTNGHMVCGRVVDTIYLNEGARATVATKQGDIEFSATANLNSLFAGANGEVMALAENCVCPICSYELPVMPASPPDTGFLRYDDLAPTTTDDTPLSEYLMRFAKAMPEIQSVTGIPLADWLAAQEGDDDAPLLTTLNALPDEAVIANTNHPGWRYAMAAELSAKQHLIAAFTSYLEHVVY